MDNFYIDSETGETRPKAGYPVLFELGGSKTFETLRKSLDGDRPAAPPPPSKPPREETEEAVLLEVDEIPDEIPQIPQRTPPLPRPHAKVELDSVIAAVPVVWAHWALAAQRSLEHVKLRDATAGVVTAVITLDPQWTCQEVLDKFAELEITGAPLSDRSGTVELFDILSLIVRHPQQSLLERFEGSQKTYVQRALALPVSAALGSFNQISAEQAALSISPNPELGVIETMALLSKHWRITTLGRPQRLISQSGAARFLHSLQLFDEVPLSSTGAIDDVVFTDEEENADMVLAAMVSHRVSTLAIIKNGRIKDEISLTDLPDLLSHDLNQPIAQLLRECRGPFSASKLLTCSPSTTVGKLLTQLASAKGRHHVWVTQGIRKLVGVVTVTSILQAITGV